MNAGGARFWQLGEASQWRGLRHAVFDTACQTLRLASERVLQPALTDAQAFTQAQLALDRVPRAIDETESVASFDAASQSVVVQSSLPSLNTVLSLPEPPTDLCLGADGVLYIALGNRVRAHCLRGRWADADVALAGFQPWRLSPAAGGGVWVLERATGRLARVQGAPLRTETPPREDYDARVFRPTPENGNPLRLHLVAERAWEPADRAVALASGPGGELAVLAWAGGEGEACVHVFDVARGRYAAPLRLQGAAYAYGLAWLSGQRVAVRVPGRRDAPAYELGAAKTLGRLAALGEVYPLAADALEAGFANGPVTPPFYPVGERGAQPLHALSLHQWARSGEAAHYSLDPEPPGATDAQAHLIDSGDVRTVWHRLYAEAALPPGTGFTVHLATSNEPQAPASTDAQAWHAHHFGAGSFSTEAGPRAAWQREPSELPAHGGLLQGERVPGQRGLFGVLVQGSHAKVRSLSGRYLWLRLSLHGDGRATPEIAALRAWAGRVDWVQRHLPRLYHETLFGEAAAQPGPASPADFLHRLVANFESVLTPLEDRIAAAHLLTDPQATPAEHLDWLAAWVGVGFDKALGENERREWLLRSGELARWHGTRRGLELALDVATGHAVQGGEVLVIEDFRLRRILATLLGVDLADEQDPLLPGLAVSGNSIVGDTLFVGDAPRAELMALFREEQATEAEDAAVIDFDRRLAHRATVLVHNELGGQNLGLIRRIVRAQAPAHVEVRVATATWPLLVGVASLVGVDTYLGPPRPPRAARVQRSSLGRGDLVFGTAWLDARLSGALPAEAAPPNPLPLADAGPDALVASGSSFTLDASASSAAPGRTLTEYQWRWHPPGTF